MDREREIPGSWYRFGEGRRGDKYTGESMVVDKESVTDVVVPVDIVDPSMNDHLIDQFAVAVA